MSCRWSTPAKGDLVAGTRMRGTGSAESANICGQRVGAGRSRLGLVPKRASHAREWRSWPRSSPCSAPYARSTVRFLRHFSAKGTGWRGSTTRPRKPSKSTWQIATRNGMRFHIGSAHRLLGEVAMHTDLAQAAPHFETSIAILRDIHAENELALAYAGYGRWHAQQGDMTQARDYLTRRSGNLRTPRHPGRARQGAASSRCTVCSVSRVGYRQEQHPLEETRRLVRPGAWNDV